MNESQRVTLARLLGWEVQTAQGSYIQMGCILPDGRFVDMTQGPAVDISTPPEGTIIVGTPAER